MYRKIMELESAISNLEMLYSEQTYFEDENAVDTLEAIQELEKELVSLRKKWAESEEDLCYSC